MEIDFKNTARVLLENYLNIKLVSKLIKISEFKKKFDFVSIDESKKNLILFQ